MKRAGQVVLFRFPQTDLAQGKLRPALLLAKLPGNRDDWLMCMVSSQLSQFLPEFDEIMQQADADYADSGLKVPSVIRVGRLAVIAEGILLGSVGEIGAGRLQRIKDHLAAWIGRS